MSTSLTPVFLFDKFGASQVTEWVETSGRIVSDKQNDVETGTIKVELNTSTDVVKPVRLLEMTVLTNTQDQPIDYTTQVAGTVLGPGDVIELPGFTLDIDWSEGIRYFIFTTIIGETMDGTAQCNGNSNLECIIGPTNAPTNAPSASRGECANDPDFLYKNKEGKDCAWALEKPKNCNKRQPDSGGKQVKFFCPKQCKEKCLFLSSAPTAFRTSSPKPR